MANAGRDSQRGDLVADAKESSSDDSDQGPQKEMLASGRVGPAFQSEPAEEEKEGNRQGLGSTVARTEGAKPAIPTLGRPLSSDVVGPSHVADSCVASPDGPQEQKPEGAVFSTDDGAIDRCKRIRPIRAGSKEGIHGDSGTTTPSSRRACARRRWARIKACREYLVRRIRRQVPRGEKSDATAVVSTTLLGRGDCHEIAPLVARWHLAPTVARDRPQDKEGRNFRPMRQPLDECTRLITPGHVGSFLFPPLA